MNVLALFVCAILPHFSHVVLAAPPLAAPPSTNIFPGDLNTTLPFDVSSLLDSSLNVPGEVSDPWDMPITTDWGDFTVRWFSYGGSMDSTIASQSVGKAYRDAAQHALSPGRSTAMRNDPNFTYYHEGVRLFMQLAGTEHFLFWRQWTIILAQFAWYGESNSWKETRFYLFRGRGTTGAYIAFGFLRSI